MKNKINVAVLGSTGFVGMELVKILSRHENVNINFLGSESNKGEYFTSINKTKKYLSLPVLKDNNLFDPSDSDYVFLALPHGISNQYVKNFYEKIKIIDLSADFRLDDYNIFKESYGNVHSCKELLTKFVYGLAEVNRNIILNSKYISVPGCYPTSVLLPLIPLFNKKLIKSNNIIIDSKSGYSGAGKNFNLENIKSQDSYNFYNYNTNNHRHIPEIKQELLKCNNNENVKFSFNPHILPIYRGMISTIYCDLEDHIIKKDIIDQLKLFEKNNVFIKYIDEAERLDFYSIQNTNFCKIKIFNHFSDKKIIIVSGIDNLIKGAAGQAVQCLNIMEGLDETKSLI